MDQQTKHAIEKSFCGLVDLYGLSRVAKMKGISRNQAQKRYLNERDGVERDGVERDGVERERRPRKPKPIR